MKNALIKDTFREIRHSMGRFLSIFAIVALGCGFFAGIKATMPDMVQTAEEYFEENRLMDIKLVSSIGVKSSDVEAVKKADNVEGVMAGYSKDVFYFYNNQNLVLKCMSYNDTLDDSSPHKLNNLVLTEGRLPENEGECVVEVKMSSPDTFKIGEKLTFSEPEKGKELTETLSHDTYEIVGIVTSPLYIGYERDATTVGNGTIVSNVFLPETDFVTDYYTELYVKLSGTEDNEPFSDEYKESVEELGAPAIEAFEESVNARYDDLVISAEEKISSAEETAQTLESLLNLDEKSLTGYLADITAQVNEAQKAYDSAEEGSGAKLLAKSELLQKQQAMGITAELAEDIQNNSTEAHDRYTAELENARAEIETSKAQLAGQKEPAFYRFDRFEASSDYSSFYGDSQKIDSIAKVFPVFFILVAGLVCLTTMTRMVEEQRIQIGTYKALGYSSGKIAAKFLAYSAIASAAGSFIGTAVGLKLFPYIIYDCYKIMYNIPKIYTPFKPGYMLICCGVSIACTSAAVLYSCIRELKSVPGALMRPKPPHSGKRVLLENVGFIWNRLSFLSKVTLRNLFRYKKRFVMTLVGVIGCTALIVTGFGLKYSIKSIADKQFNEVFVYDGMAVLNSADFEEKQLDSALSSIGEIDRYMLAQTSDGTAEANGVSQSVTMFVMKEPESLGNFIALSDIRSGKKLSVQDGSVVITQKLAKMLDLQAGDVIPVTLSEEKTVDLKISAVSKNYALHYIFITPDTYREIYGKDPVYNVSFVNLKEGIDENSFKEQLISNDEFYGLTYKTDSSRGFLNSVDSLDAIVVLLIACAGLLAIVVLYNLANINITERVREIATVKVLGFYDGETSDYICRENYISAVIGILAGFGAGKILHYFVVITAEVDIVMFNRQLVWWAYALGAVMTFVFTALVNLILHFKLKKVDMVMSLKSVE